MLPWIINNLAAGNESASKLDDNFNACLRWAVAAGGADALTATYTPPNTTLDDGLILGVRASAANATPAPTFSPDGLPAHTITKKGGSALAVSDIPGNLAEILLRYNLANTRWELLNPSAATTSVPGTLLNTINFTAQTVALTSISNASPGVLTAATAQQLPENGSPVQLSTSGGLPAPLAILTTYYVINASGTTFNLSLTQGGAAINTTSAGSGTHTLNSVYVKNANSSYIITEGWGAGGGGGGVSAVSSACAGGGGAGGSSRQKILAASVGATETITIGAGGTAGANTGGTGGTGGTTSFGAHSTATGGAGGVGSTSASTSQLGGVGGAGASGDINLTGAPGLQSVSNNLLAEDISGTGASTSLGGAGIGRTSNVGAAGANAVNNSGSGGSGASENGSAQVGGIGGSGRVIVYEYS